MPTKRGLGLIIFFISVVLACQFPQETIQPTVDTYDNYQINVQSNLGQVNAFNGVQGIPFLGNRLVDLTTNYRAAGVSLVRFPVDDGFEFSLASVFPDAALPPDDPRSYHFEEVDKQIAMILDTGAKILWQANFDIGGGDRWGRCCQGGRPPQKTSRWANVIRHVLMHFNDGWGEGHEWDIQYVEFINEPCSLGGFQCESAEGRRQLFDTYAAFANAIESYNQEFNHQVRIIGIAEPNSADVEAMRLMDDFLIYVASNHVPLDIFSYHYFGSPASQRSVAQKIHQAGFSDLPVWNTEWNMTFNDIPSEVLQDGDPGLVSAYFGSQNALAKIYFQGILDQAVMYRATRTSRPSNDDELGLSELYFNKNGAPTPAYLTWQAFNLLSQQTPVRLEVFSSEGDTALIAARSLDSSHLGFLMSYWCKTDSSVCPARAYDLQILNLPPGQTYRMTETVIDQHSRDLIAVPEPALKVGQDGMLILHDRIELWSMHYWQLHAEP
jgi:hypothetical protein